MSTPITTAYPTSRVIVMKSSRIPAFFVLSSNVMVRLVELESRSEE